MSEVTVRHEPTADDDANPAPAPEPQRRSHAGRNLGAAITGVVAAGAAYVGFHGSETQEVAGTAVAAHSADNPGRTPNAAPQPSTSAAPTAEAVAPTQLNVEAEIPDEQVERLFGLPEGSFDGHWDIIELPDVPAQEGVPVPIHSRMLPTPGFKFNVALSVYEGQKTYSEAVGGTVEDLPSEGGMSIVSIPQLKMVEGSLEAAGHDYTITVSAANATPEAKVEFLEAVVEDMTGAQGH